MPTPPPPRTREGRKGRSANRDVFDVVEMGWVSHPGEVSESIRVPRPPTALCQGRGVSVHACVFTCPNDWPDNVH